MKYTTTNFLGELLICPPYAGANAIRAINAYAQNQRGREQNLSQKVTSSITGACFGVALSLGMTVVSIHGLERLTENKVTTTTPHYSIVQTSSPDISQRTKVLGSGNFAIGIADYVLTRTPPKFEVRLSSNNQATLDDVVE